jgi:hypothetical protein
VAWCQSGVVRSGNQPIPGATVTATEDGKTYSTATGADGRFSFDSIPGGKGTVEVQMFGFEPAQKPAVFGPTGPDLEFNLQLGQSQMARRMGQFGSRGTQTDANASQLENDIAATTAAPAATPAPTSSNESFLVSGSLSQGLAQNAAPDGGFGPPPGAGGEGPGGAGAPGPGGAAPGFGQSGGGGGGFGGGGGGGFGGGGGGGRGGFGGGPGGDGRQRGGNRGPAQFGNRRRPAQIHGMVFGTLNNSALDAKPFSISGSDVPQPAYAQVRYGFLAAGPLTIPKVIKDPSTFFSISYFGTRAKNPQVNFSTVPTEEERQGNFSQAVQSVGANQTAPVQLFYPGTTTPIANNVIPASMISPIAQGLLQYIPLPNAPGLVNNYFYDSAVNANSDNVNGRVQRNITSKDRLAYHLSFQDRNGQTVQAFGFTDLTSGYGLSTDLSWTHNFSPTLINTAQVTFNRNRNETTPYFAYGQDVAAELGIAGTSTSAVNYGPPNLNFTNFASLSDSAPVLTRNQGQTGSDNFLIVRGKHSVRLGFNYARNDLSSITDQNGRGTFNFSGISTSEITPGTGLPVANTGYDLADFLLGLPQSSSIRYGDASTYFSQNVLTGYVNDDWKALSSLTFNVGLRYEYFSPFSEKYNQIANLDVAPNYSAVAVVTPGEVGPYTGLFPSGLVDPQYHHFSPRLGLAWKVPHLKKSTIVRSGYGIYYNTQAYQPITSRLAEQPPFAVSDSVNTSPEDILTLAQGFVSTSPTDITNTYAIAKNFKVPYAQTWTFSIQRDLWHGIVSEVNYLGTKGTHLDVETEPNEGPSANLTAAQRTQLGDAVGFIYDTSAGNSIYNALNVRVQQRFRRGVSWIVNYSFSKSIDDSTTFGGVGNTVAENWLDLEGDRGLSSFDRRQVLTGSWVLTSPIGGQGSHFAPDSWTARLLREWQLSGSITAETGIPFTARALGNEAILAQTNGVGSARAEATGLPVTSSTGFFDLGAFVPPASGTFGDAGRNTIPGPDLISVNVSFGRSFQFGESRRRLELRFETTNALNQVNYNSINTVVNAINYGAPLATSGMRQSSIVLRFRF